MLLSHWTTTRWHGGVYRMYGYSTAVYGMGLESWRLLHCHAASPRLVVYFSNVTLPIIVVKH